MAASAVLCVSFPSQNLHLKDSPLLLLALYEKIALSRASTLPSRKVLPIV